MSEAVARWERNLDQISAQFNAVFEDWCEVGQRLKACGQGKHTYATLDEGLADARAWRKLDARKKVLFEQLHKAATADPL